LTSGDFLSSAPTLAVTPAAEDDDKAADVVTLTIDERLLQEAVYPAYVDLTLVDFPSSAAAAQHTFASSAQPDSNFSVYQRPEAPGYAELWHGRRPGRADDNEVYLRFPGLAEALRGATIESASLGAFPYWQNSGEEARSTWLAPVLADWDLRSLTWNTRPAPGIVANPLGEPVSPDATGPGAETQPEAEAPAFDTTQGQWTAMDLTAYAQSIVDGAAVDYGLLLHASEQGRGYWKRFVGESTLGAGALEPRLTVEWSALRPTAGESSFDETGNVVNLSWSHATLSQAPSRVRIQISTDNFATILSETRLKRRHAGDVALAVPTRDLAPGTYSFRVRARYADETAWSRWSNTGTFTIAAPATPAAPAPTVEPTRTMDDVRFHQTV
jgi:hypothetical protein